jgi:hypothetical protein
MLHPLLGAVQPLASLFSLNGRPRYLHAGWFLISVANLVVIVTMIVVFVLALFLPFPHGKDHE